MSGRAPGALPALAALCGPRAGQSSQHPRGTCRARPGPAPLGTAAAANMAGAPGRGLGAAAIAPRRAPGRPRAPSGAPRARPEPPRCPGPGAGRRGRAAAAVTAPGEAAQRPGRAGGPGVSAEGSRGRAGGTAGGAATAAVTDLRGVTSSGSDG